MHADLIPRGLNKALRLDIQITHREEEKMELMPESIEEFRAAECSLLLGNTELSLLKSEVETEVPPPEPKKRGKRALDNPGNLATPAKKKKSQPGDTGALVRPTSTKRKAVPADPSASTASMKKVKGL